MKPYRPLLRVPVLPFGLVVLLVGCLIILPAQAAATGKNNRKNGSRSETLTRSAFEHFYNLEYEKAEREFELVVEANPDDPFAHNHLLTGVLFRELYRIGALDSELYAKDAFLTSRQFAVDPIVRSRIKEISDRALALAEERLKANPNDVHALYARGVTRGLRSTTSALLDKTWFAALRSAVGARRDHERVLELDPEYADAKMIVGIHNYVIGSLSWAVKAAASVVGISGSKKKGLEYLYAAANGGGESATDSKIALALFLRREQRYPEAISMVQSLVKSYPRNFLYALEEANLRNAAGQGREAITAYRRILEGTQTGQYADPRLEQVEYGLAEALRGQRDYKAAVEAYETIPTYKRTDPELCSKANLAAGQMYDLLQQREQAKKKYEAVIASDSGSEHAHVARRHLKQAYRER
jgi:tetratricopeptide (TPR) repeat protein